MLRIGGQRVPPKTLLMIGSDIFLIVAGLLAATVIRFYNNGMVRPTLHASETIWRFVIVVVVCEISLYYNDLYSTEVLNRRNQVVIRLLQALGASCVSLALLYYLAPNLSL